MCNTCEIYVRIGIGCHFFLAPKALGIGFVPSPIDPPPEVQHRLWASQSRA